MGDIKRYTISSSDYGCCFSTNADAEGNWCEWCDVKKLKDELDVANKGLEAIRKVVVETSLSLHMREYRTGDGGLIDLCMKLIPILDALAADQARDEAVMEGER